MRLCERLDESQCLIEEGVGRFFVIYNSKQCNYPEIFEKVSVENFTLEDVKTLAISYGLMSKVEDFFNWLKPEIREDRDIILGRGKHAEEAKS